MHPRRLLAALLLVAGVAAVARRSGGRAGGSSGFKKTTNSRRSLTKRDATATKSAPSKNEQSTQQPNNVQYVGVPVQQQGGGFGGAGLFMGLSLLDSIVQEQRRAEMYRTQLEQAEKIGKSAGEIEALKAQLKAQEDKVSSMQKEADKEK